MRQLAARRRVCRMPGVEIAPSAKVTYANIHILPGCTLRIGAGSIVEGSIFFEREGASVVIGANTFLGASTVISATSVTVGNDVLVAWGSTIVDHNSHGLTWRERENDVRNWYEGKKDWRHVKSAAVRIGDRAWIGFNAIVLKGVTIGEEAVVGAGAVVTKDVPPRCAAAGNPAQVIKTITDGGSAR